MFEEPGNIPPATRPPVVPPSRMPRGNSDVSEDDAVLMHGLSTTIHETVEEVNKNEHVRDTGSLYSGLQSIPQDPNLECVVCGKIFKLGQIQNYKRHVKTCTGSK